MFYLEACESGSIFEGLLDEGLNIYATTASNAEESSWGTYCPGEEPSPPPEYETCLGDLYSVAWMEDRYAKESQYANRNSMFRNLYECPYIDSDICLKCNSGMHNLQTETLHQQYELVSL